MMYVSKWSMRDLEIFTDPQGLTRRSMKDLETITDPRDLHTATSSKRGRNMDIPTGGLHTNAQTGDIHTDESTAKTTKMSGVDKARRKKKNVVLILIDDLGVHDVGVYGSTFHDTPHIDAFASTGVRFTNAYTAHPKCGPARLALFSGTFPARFGSPLFSDLNKYGMPNAFKCFQKRGYRKMRLPLQATSMGDAFKVNGYRTGYHGKWHFGDAQGLGSPNDQGFDVSIGATHKGAVQTHFYPYVNSEHVSKQNAPPPMSWRPDGTYMADHLTDETIGTIQKFKDDPFFVVLAHYAVHGPIEAPKDLVQPYNKKHKALKETDQFTRDHGAIYRTTQDNPVYGGMMTAVDNSVGRIMQALKEMGLDQNTTVVFTSDNGGQASHATPSNVAAIPTSNAPYRHGKTWLYEGGVRVPLIVHDPDAPVSTRGRESDFVTVGTDMYPTLLDLAGLPLRPKDHVDGISTTDAIFAPTVGNATAIRDSPLFWHFSYNKPEHTKGKGGGLSLNKGQVQCSAVMDGKWKLIDFWDEGKDGRKELYNVHTDPYETKNLAQTHPEVRKRLFQKLRFWRHNWVKESDYIDLECKEEKMATLGREGERKD